MSQCLSIISFPMDKKSAKQSIEKLDTLDLHTLEQYIKTQIFDQIFQFRYPNALL